MCVSFSSSTTSWAAACASSSQSVRSLPRIQPAGTSGSGACARRTASAFSPPHATKRTSAAWASVRRVRVSRPAGGLGASASEATHASSSSSSACPGKSDAVCPSAPTPSTTASSRGVAPSVARSWRSYACAASGKGSEGSTEYSCVGGTPASPSSIRFHVPMLDSALSSATIRSSARKTCHLAKFAREERASSGWARREGMEPPDRATKKAPRVAMACVAT
mmetsp:Transcript_22062/g.54974  ORF Transcript_22062/g.54974 Transcript_22062/m.54974 type:complete len:222 (+) Transcript_22062:351-1016(+)